MFKTDNVRYVINTYQNICSYWITWIYYILLGWYWPITILRIDKNQNYHKQLSCMIFYTASKKLQRSVVNDNTVQIQAFQTSLLCNHRVYERWQLLGVKVNRCYWGGQDTLARKSKRGQLPFVLVAQNLKTDLDISPKRCSVFISANNTESSLWEFKAQKSIWWNLTFPCNVNSSEKQ